MAKITKAHNQIVSRNDGKADWLPDQEKATGETGLVVRKSINGNDGLAKWIEWYFGHGCSASESTQKIQRRDLSLFLSFMIFTVGSDERIRFTPRLAEEFRSYLITTLNQDGTRRWGERAQNRIQATLKTFTRWVDSLSPFPLGNPLAKIKAVPLANPLEVERALTENERRDLLDAADILRTVGGLSKSRRRYAKKDERPVRQGYRPHRNRAIIYTLIHSGMRRRAVTLINLSDIDFVNRSIVVQEKGRVLHTYQITKEARDAIKDYIENERSRDAEKWGSPALFLSSCTNERGDGRLSARSVNLIWNEVCEYAKVEGKTPHSARHAMGRHIIEKTGNVAAVQRQLGHKNAQYSMLYARVTRDELNAVLDKMESGYREDK
jgi:integrase